MRSPGTSKAAEPSDRLGKGEWVTAATESLAAGGVTNVRVETLAKTLGVTKGSFYWHFKDRDALLTEVLRTWKVNLTANIGALVADKTQDARQRIVFLLKLSTDDTRPDVPGGRIERAIREWATTSGLAREILQQVDAERLEILSDFYRGLGLKRLEASAYAFLFYSYALGANVINSDLGRQANKTLRDACIEILVPPAQEA